ncbi:MAG: hypothetical protein MZU84_06590 [Sphingobacterium sp.]|nr:hypothetical protein [Sphingobacterium sp.]
MGGTKSTNTIKETAAGCATRLKLTNTLISITSEPYAIPMATVGSLETAEYEIPKGSKKTSMFSFSLWIGGIDINNNLKLAAYRYGQGPYHARSHEKRLLAWAAYR